MRTRVATRADGAAMEAVIAASGIALSRGFYDDAQAAQMTREVYGVDTQLVDDGTYFVVEDDAIVACGGWSRRGTLFGSDAAKAAHGGAGDPPLDPATDAARIRAFFVAPTHARRGLGSMLMRACAEAAWDAGFRRLTLVATLPGEPLYARFGFVADERFDLVLASGLAVPLVAMSRPLPTRDVERTA